MPLVLTSSSVDLRSLREHWHVLKTLETCDYQFSGLRTHHEADGLHMARGYFLTLVHSSEKARLIRPLRASWADSLTVYVVQSLANSSVHNIVCEINLESELQNRSRSMLHASHAVGRGICARD